MPAQRRGCLHLRSRPRRRASAARHTSRGGDTPRWAAAPGHAGTAAPRRPRSVTRRCPPAGGRSLAAATLRYASALEAGGVSGPPAQFGQRVLRL